MEETIITLEFPVGFNKDTKECVAWLHPNQVRGITGNELKEMVLRNVLEKQGEMPKKMTINITENVREDCMKFMGE